jgi:hypothetical protein
MVSVGQVVRIGKVAKRETGGKEDITAKWKHEDGRSYPALLYEVGSTCLDRLQRLLCALVHLRQPSLISGRPLLSLRNFISITPHLKFLDFFESGPHLPLVKVCFVPAIVIPRRQQDGRLDQQAEE